MSNGLTDFGSCLTFFIILLFTIDFAIVSSFYFYFHERILKQKGTDL